MTTAEMLAALKQRRAATQAEIESISSAYRSRGGNPTEAESAQLLAAVEVRNAQDSRIEELSEDERSNSVARSMIPASQRGEQRHTPATISARESAIYNADADRAGTASFFGDLYRSEVQNDVGARQRLASFQAEQRATTTGSYGGLVPPAYLTDLAALTARAGRPFADSVAHMEIPEGGMSIIVPRGTTGASVAVQATQNTAVSETDQVMTDITLPVATIAGAASVSRQSLERGAPGIDRLIFADLAGAYAAALEQQCIQGSGAAGQILGVLNTAGINQATAYTAAATATTFWNKVAGQIAAISAARFLPPTHLLVSPRRWAWLMSQVDSTGRPLVTPTAGGPSNAEGVYDQPTYGGVVGRFMGLNVVVSAQVPTNIGSGPEDVAVLYRGDDVLLFENGDGSPKELRFEQTAGATLTVKLVAYNYAAFTAGRYPNGIGVVGGNSGAGFGQVQPTF